MDTRDVIEIELLNGTRILLQKSWSKIYNLKEKTVWHLGLSSSFPFLRLKKQRCVSFKFRTKFETIDDFFDPTYTVNCTLTQFASMFNVNILPFEKALVESDLRYAC